MLVAAALRVVLVEHGGQFFFPDEARYAVSRDAADLIAQGKWKQGLDLPLAGGDHVGFKLLGILPGLLEHATHRNNHIPALFLAACSLGTVLLLGLVARRLGAGAVVQAWVVIAGCASAVLFYNGRHLLPYDLSMFLAVLALAVGLVRGPRRAVLSGFIAGWAVLSYYGYWTLAGLVLIVAAVHPAQGWLDFAKRSALLLAGFLIALALPLGFNGLLGSRTLIAGARVLSGSITSGDYRAHVVPWAYLWDAEKLWLLAALAALGYAAKRLADGVRKEGIRALRAPEAVALASVLLLWIFFLVTANGLHKFVVHGRLVRQMTPFLILALGFGLEQLLHGKTARFVWGVGALLAANAIWTFWQPLALRFPAEFRITWEPELKRASENGGAASYERFVNVTQYVFEPEVLLRPPLRTLAAAPHPYSYLPYLFEGFTPEERRIRRSVDHRMRVVEMGVPEAQRVQGAPYGKVALRLTFPAHRGGFIEPLLSVGTRGAGDVFFVRYVTDNLIQLGMESVGNALLFSEPVTVDLAKPHEIECFSGSLLPAPGAAVPSDLSPKTISAAGRLVWIRLDGNDLINEYALSHAARPDQVYAGANVANAGASGSQFSGEISSVVRGGLPPLPEQRSNSAFGPVRVVCGPARGELGRPEPLVVVGASGKAVLCYIIPLENNRARFGVEIWGRGTWQSEPVTLKPGISNEILCSFGSLYPTVGSSNWGKLSAPDQRLLKRRVQIRVNGATVLEFTTATPEWIAEAPPIAVGKNPAGGSVVLASYLGVVGTWEQLPVERALE